MATELLLQADVSLPSWAWAALIGAIMLVLGSFITRFTKHSEVTISGPVEIRVLQENHKRIESQMNRGFQDLKDIFEGAEGRTHTWKNQILDKLNAMSLTEERLGWRLDSVEKELTEIREKKIGTIELELDDLRNHKNRITFLERELKDLKDTGKRHGGDKAPL